MCHPPKSVSSEDEVCTFGFSGDNANVIVVVPAGTVFAILAISGLLSPGQQRAASIRRDIMRTVEEIEKERGGRKKRGKFWVKLIVTTVIIDTSGKRTINF